MTKIEIEVGDWVRFVDNHSRRVVIDVVLYTREANYFPRPTLAVCQTATVDVSDILEIRKATR